MVIALKFLFWRDIFWSHKPTLHPLTFDLLCSNRSNANSLVCLSWQPPHPCQKAGSPCIALDRAGSGNLDRCWHIAVFHLLCSKRQTQGHTGRWRKCINKYTWLTHDTLKKSSYAQEKRSFLHLVNVITMGTISTKTSRAWTTLPRPVWRAAAVHSSKAGVRQAPIWGKITFLLETKLLVSALRF